MSTTYTSLFRRKSLPSIFAKVDKLRTEIDEWLKQASSDKDGLTAEQDRISAELAALDHDIVRVTRAKALAADFTV
jgi:hypothetical protein